MRHRRSTTALAPTETLDLAHGLPPGTLAATAFAPERLTPATTGRISDEQWRTETETALATACGSPATAHAVVTAWTNLKPDLDTQIATLLRTARRTLTVALVSNATTRLEHDLEKLELRTGIRKRFGSEWQPGSPRSGAELARLSDVR